MASLLCIRNEQCLYITYLGAFCEIISSNAGPHRSSCFDHSDCGVEKLNQILWLDLQGLLGFEALSLQPSPSRESEVLRLSMERCNIERWAKCPSMWLPSRRSSDPVVTVGVGAESGEQGGDCRDAPRLADLRPFHSGYPSHNHII